MQVVDPTVSRRKFAREVGRLRDLGPVLQARGWWIMHAEFPMVKVAFATVNTKPRMIPFAVLADFTNYDVEPLDIKFVDPFEDRELLPNEMMTRLPRLVPVLVPAPGEEGIAVPQQMVELYQHYPNMPHLPGFLCLPGTRAYHTHPAHTGDPWEIHRAAGEGRLFALLETIWRYGTAQASHLAVNLALGMTGIAA